MTRSGFSFLEIMVAIVILSVGVLAAAALQTSALQGTSRAETMQSVTKVAESELALRRQTLKKERLGDVCAVSYPDGYSCSVDSLPCTIAAGVFSCAQGIDPQAADAYEISVTVSDTRRDAITLTSIAHRGEAVASQGGGGGGGDGDDGDGGEVACWPPGQCGGNGGGKGNGKP